MKRTSARAAAVAVVIGCLAAVPAVASASASAFVGRSGQTLTLNGSPWRFIAYNDYQLTSMPAASYCGRALDQATLNSIMQDAKASGANVIRTWFFQSYYDMSNANGSWQQVTPTYAAFDRVLNAAAANGLKVIPVLVNEWQDCEPPSVDKNLAFYQSGYKAPGYGYPLSYKAYATTIAQHYASNPTIAFWQLGNELESNTPSGCSATAESQGASALRAFADDMTDSIKAVDPNHLVSLGTLGTGQCGLAGSDYQYVHAGAIDLCEYHDYDDATHSIPNDGYNRLAQRITQCRALNKPLFVGEAGIVADVGDYGQSTGTINSTSLQLRAGFFDAKMTAAFNSGLVGYAIWDKEQDASNSSYNENNGRYEVGPSSLFFDPTNSLTASMAKTFGAFPGSVRFGFEDGGVDGWNVAWGSNNLSLSNSNTEAWGGFDSLALTLGGGVASPAARTYATTGAGKGTTITYHVYLPSWAPNGLQVEPYVSNNLWQQTFGPATSLLPGWNVVQWTVPSTVSTPLQAIGIQVNNGPGWSGSVYLDDVAW